MSNAAASPNIVSLDEYRRARAAVVDDDAATSASSRKPLPRCPTAPAVWVYWVPVWVW